MRSWAEHPLSTATNTAPSWGTGGHSPVTPQLQGDTTGQGWAVGKVSWLLDGEQKDLMVPHLVQSTVSSKHSPLSHGQWGGMSARTISLPTAPVSAVLVVPVLAEGTSGSSFCSWGCL